MPDGAEVTKPLPVPAGATVSNSELSVKVALKLTEEAPIVNVQGVVVPVQVPVPPDQPVKVEPVAGVTVIVTTVVFLTLLTQVPLVVPVVSLQLMRGLPAFEVTRPLPLPGSTTVSVPLRLKVAVRFCACVMRTVQGLVVPMQVVLLPPDQPVNVETPPVAAAVNVTVTP